MFVEDLKNDFYNVLLGNRVLLLVHYDVDAVCTCKILQNLFKCDNIAHTLVPVGGVSDLKKAYDENHEEIKYVVLVNCGGTIDLVDILQPEEDVVFFVLDWHKPTDVCNVYSDGQVRLVFKDEEENIPNFDDIFRDDEDEETEADHGSGREGLEAAVEKRRERRQWEERRHTLMFNYTQFSYCGKPSALVALELCYRISPGGCGALWAGGVAAAAAAALLRRAPAAALLDAAHLHRCLAAAAPTEHASKVVLEKDAWLPLYREWTLEAAIRHSPLLAPRLRLHTVAGGGRARRLLADMGFPLQQARQSYRSMDVELRHCLLASLEAACEKHNLPVPNTATCILKRELAPPRAALDAAFATLALIEHDTIPRGEGFQLALSLLDVSPSASAAAAWRRGVAAAQRALAAVAAAGAAPPTPAGPFTYLIFHHGAPETPIISGPHWLGVAARWAAAALGGGRPLLAAADTGARACTLLGVPPRVDQEPRNLFGAAFEQAATRCSADVSLDNFDTSVVTLPIEQRAQFLDALTALLS